MTMDWWKPRSRPACFMYSKAFWELKHWSFTHHPQGDSGLPGQPGAPGKEGKRVSKPKQVAACVGWIHVAYKCLCDRPISETGLREWPGSSWNERKIGELCVGLVSWEWLWIFNCKVNGRLTARVADPSRKQSQGWFTVQSWHARTYWENDTVSLLILSFVSQRHRPRVKLLVCPRHESFMWNLTACNKLQLRISLLWIT